MIGLKGPSLRFLDDISITWGLREDRLHGFLVPDIGTETYDIVPKAFGFEEHVPREEPPVVGIAYGTRTGKIYVAGIFSEGLPAEKFGTERETGYGGERIANVALPFDGELKLPEARPLLDKGTTPITDANKEGLEKLLAWITDWRDEERERINAQRKITGIGPIILKK